MTQNNMKPNKFTHYFFASLMVLSIWSCRENISVNQESAESPEELALNPLPSWNDGDAKNSILAYVESVTQTGSENFIPVSERIAVFDNDGTLWSEQPAYFQLFFAMDRIRELAGEHPEWESEEPFRSVLANDMESLGEQGLEGLLRVVMASHAGMDSETFAREVQDWISGARHPQKDVPYIQLVYKPMLELLDLLRTNGFKVYIVSGGGIDFMRATLTEIYQIPEEQIIGSRLKTTFDYNNGNPRITRQPELEFINDKEGKPLNIQKIIGKKPVFAAGNSDGDLAMLQWTASNSYKSHLLYVHHTDSIREWAYDRNSHIGKLDKGLDQAREDNWNVVDMAKDWIIVFPE